jgi:hypothetical protein
MATKRFKAPVRSKRAVRQPVVKRPSPLWQDLFVHLAGSKFVKYVSEDDNFNTDEEILQTVKLVFDRMLDDLYAVRADNLPMINLPSILASRHEDDFDLIYNAIKPIFPDVRYKLLVHVSGPHNNFPRAIFYRGDRPSGKQIKEIMDRKGVTLL